MLPGGCGMRGSVYLSLLLVFVPLSLTTVGGGQSVVAEIHRQAVSEYHWMTDGQFLDAFALSRLSPGPGSLLVTLVGWQVSGWGGAIVASVAIFLPSSVLVYGLARLWTAYRGAAWQKAIEHGLAPVAAGMILAASLTVLEAAQGGWLAWVVAGASTGVLLLTEVSPFLLLGAGAVIFLILAK